MNALAPIAPYAIVDNINDTMDPNMMNSMQTVSHYAGSMKKDSNINSVQSE